MTNTQMQVKEVNFNGDMLIGIKTEKGIYTAANKTCECLGLSDGQKRRQVENLSLDLVLKQGVANLRIPTKGGNQDVLCILIDFLPLWLAKISITPAMKKSNPELVEKLIAYQLKAKDVLAAAFLPTEYQSTEQLAILKQMEQKYQRVLSGNEAMQSSIKDLASDIAFIKHEVFKMAYAPNNSEWKKKVNAKIVEVNKATRISCTSLLNQIYIQMRVNGCDLIALAHRYEFENGLTQCPIIEYIDKHENVKEQFEILLDELMARTFRTEIKPAQQVTEIPAEKTTTSTVTTAEAIKTLMQPLIEMYNDHSSGGCATYRKVYAAMGVCWKYRLTKFMNEHELEVIPKKLELIKDDKKLLELFADTVIKLLTE